LFGFVGIEFPPTERIEEVLGQKINAARRGNFPPPSEWSETERKTVQRFVAETANALGYEL
jgi:hypothetical protein